MTVHYPANPQQDWVRVYNQPQTVASSAMHDTVQAYSTALDQLMVNFLADLRKK
jgi:hypothetical protein